MLMVATGIPSYQIAEQLNATNNTIGRWRKHFLDQKMGGIIKDRPRGANQGGKKTSELGKLRQKIIKKTTEGKPKGSTHWTTKSMAKAIGSTLFFVNRVWQQAGLKPHLHKSLNVK